MQLHACLQRGALWGSRREEQVTLQETGGAERSQLPSVPAAPDLSRDGFSITQRQEHCRTAFAFSILSVTKASRCILAMAASRSAPGEAGEEQGGMPVAVPTSPCPAPSQALTHHCF